MTKIKWDEVICKVNSKPPILNIGKVEKKPMLNNIVRNTRYQDSANIDLVKDLYAVHTHRNQYLSFRNLPFVSQSNYHDRKKELKRAEAVNAFLANVLSEAVCKVESNVSLSKEWKRRKERMNKQMQHPVAWSPWKMDLVNAITPQPTKLRPSQLRGDSDRPRVSIEISLQGVGVIGRMVFILYKDYAPRTVENFLAYCDKSPSPTYKNCHFYNIVPGFFCSTGDVEYDRGLGGFSIYGANLAHENYSLNHSQTGVLSMDNKEEGLSGSQFLITFQPLRSMDNRYVAFGQIISGLPTLKRIERFGTKTGRPFDKLWISAIKEF